MVSELSARLMRGHNFMTSHHATTSAFQTTSSGGSGSKTNRVVSPNPISDHEPMMSISACTEKLDQISTKSVRLSRKSPPPAVEPSSDGVGAGQGCFKRRKVDELQFAASRVKDDLAQGGLSYPALDTSLRHHLEFDRNDDSAAATRGISLLTSKSVSDSPFLTKSTTDVYGMASMCDFGNLFSATYDSYSKPPSSSSSSSNNSISISNTGSILGSSNATYVTTSDVGSICSFSSSENSSSGGEGISHIEPRLEDALNNKKVQMEEVREAEEQMAATAAQRRAIYSNPITIRDAFENSHEARIVTLSFAPFLVVHVNPAYTRATGLSPADILGKPFHEVIEDPTCKSNTSKASSLTGLHEKVSSFVLKKGDNCTSSSDNMDANNNNNKFSVRISVVGPEPDPSSGRSSKSSSFVVDHKTFTHYMISLAEHDDAREEDDEEDDDDEESVSNPTITTATLLPLTTSVPTAVSPTTTTTPSPLVVSAIPILEPSDVALMPTMRLHCGVMG